RAGGARVGVLLLVDQAVHRGGAPRARALARHRARRRVPGGGGRVAGAVVRLAAARRRGDVLGRGVRHHLRAPGRGIRPGARAALDPGAARHARRPARGPAAPPGRRRVVLPALGAPHLPGGLGVPRRRGRDGGAAALRARVAARRGCRRAGPEAHRPRVLPHQRRRLHELLRADTRGPAGEHGVMRATVGQGGAGAGRDGAERSHGPPVTLAITGASGAVYAVRALEVMNRVGVPVRLIISSTGSRLLREEADTEGAAGRPARTGDASRVGLYDDADRGATPASGSAPSRGMLICPCSMGTLASVAQGTTRSLIERAADVTLKERRPLVLVPRETPYSIIHLENMLRLARAGALILPASPGFYHRPTTIGDLVDFVVARALSHVGVEHDIGPRWQSGEPAVDA